MQQIGKLLVFRGVADETGIALKGFSNQRLENTSWMDVKAVQLRGQFHVFRNGEFETELHSLASESRWSLSRSSWEDEAALHFAASSVNNTADSP